MLGDEFEYRYLLQGNEVGREDWRSEERRAHGVETEFGIRTIKRIHQSIAGNSSTGTAGGGRERVMNASLISAHQMLDGLICCEVDGMSRAWPDSAVSERCLIPIAAARENR